MADLGGEFRFFQGIHERNDLRIDISISIRRMTNKLGRMVTYLDRLLPIKSRNSLIMWSYKIT